MSGLVKDLVGLGFEILEQIDSDLVTVGEIVRHVDVKNVVEGTTTRTPTAYPINRIIETKFQASELTGEVDLKTDVKLIVHTDELPFLVKKPDQIHYSTGIKWRVENVMSVTGRSVWILHCRKL